MEDLYISPGVIGALGAEGKDPLEAVRAQLGRDRLLLPREPMLEPALTMRQNYRLVKRYSPPEKGETLAGLLELSGLKKKGWDRPFRKDMDGERQLWKIMLTLTMSSGGVLLSRPLAGLNSDQRTCLNAMLSAWTEAGNSAVLTLGGLKEVFALPCIRLLWLVKGDRVLPLGRETAEAYRDRESTDGFPEELWKEAEG